MPGLLLLAGLPLLGGICTAVVTFLAMQDLDRGPALGLPLLGGIDVAAFHIFGFPDDIPGMNADLLPVAIYLMGWSVLCLGGLGLLLGWLWSLRR